MATPESRRAEKSARDQGIPLPDPKLRGKSPAEKLAREINAKVEKSKLGNTNAVENRISGHINENHPPIK